MISATRVEQENAELQKRWQSLGEQLSLLQHHRDLETRPDEKLRLDSHIETKRAERNAVGSELDLLERRAAEVRAQALLLEARERERKQAFDHAISCWREISALAVPGYDSRAEIERLTQLKGRDERRQDLLRQLSPRFKDIVPIFKSVAEFLQRLGPGPAGAELLLIEQFVRHELDAADFIALWQQLDAEPPEPAAALDFSALYRRLARGEIALFLGADVPHLFDPGQSNLRLLAAELAADLKLQDAPSKSSMSAVAEYFQMTPEHGTGALVRSLSSRLPEPTGSNPLYELLSRIQSPLLLITACYDSQLESAFTKAGKRYVVASSVISAMPGYYPGQVLLRYSDRDEPEAPQISDNLSQLSLLEKGYSIIFKLRGTCPSPERVDERDLCSWVLSERSHFECARYLDKLLPSYLGRQMAVRGFWFLGFAPDEWEDRLLASAILDSRRSPEPAHVVWPSVSQFENAYWTSRGVRRHAFELPEFVHRLQGGAR